MFRGLDEETDPTTVRSKGSVSAADEDLKSLFQQRVHDKREQMKSQEAKNWKQRVSDPEEEAKNRESARQKRDSWVYTDLGKTRGMAPEDSGNYKTSMVRFVSLIPALDPQSNEKYVKYYDEDARDLEYNGPYKRPPHPRQRHRCDYHLEDIMQSVVDRKVPVWSCFKVWFACMRSPVGQEPERIRTEVWKW